MKTHVLNAIIFSKVLPVWENANIYTYTYIYIVEPERP